MTNHGLKYWLPMLARFTTGQAVIQLVNLATGLVILRLLDIDEYALYVLAAFLQATGSIGSDLGTSHGVTSIGAPLRDRKDALASLIRGALYLRARLFWLACSIVVLVGFLILRGNVAGLEIAVTIMALSIGTVWVQQSATLATSVLNAQHDSAGLFRAGLLSAVVRLVLAGILCSMFPCAPVALAVNLFGTMVLSWQLWAQYGGYERLPQPEDTVRANDLFRFALPLLPINLYSLCVGQISVFLLGLAGAAGAVAEFGALGRLGQLVGLLSLLNGFFVMPYFGRIGDRQTFVRRVLQMLTLLSLACGTLIFSSAIAPEIWLAILGQRYSNLQSELVLAVTTASLGVAGNVAYAIVLATRKTRDQWAAIPIILIGQFAYIAYADIDGTRQALILNLIPVALGVIFQSAILVRIVIDQKSWER